MSIDRSRHNHAILNRNVHGKLVETLDCIRVSRYLRAGLPERRIDGLAGQGSTRPHVNLRSSDILTDERIEYRGIRDQISAEARRLIVFEHGDGSNLAGVIHSYLDLDRAETGDVVGIGCNHRLSRSTGRSSRRSKHRFLIARVRSDAERVLCIGKNLSHCTDEGRGRNGRTTKGIHIVRKRIRVSGNRNELILEFRLADSAAETGGLLQCADIHLCHIALGADAKRNRDRSAVALRVGHKGVTGNLTGLLALAHKHLINQTAFGQILDINDLLIIAAGEHLAQSFLLRSNLLFSNRPLGHFIGDSQADRRYEREDEKTNSEFHDITHSSLPPQSSWYGSHARSAETQRSSAEWQRNTTPPACSSQSGK